MANNIPLLFVSHNRHKVEEMKKLLPSSIQLSGLQDIGWTDDIPEPFDTFEDNARAKAEQVWRQTGLACFADDSGLEVDTLDKRPGVYSARYAGEHKSSVDNIHKVLHELDGMTDRRGRFVAVIAYADTSGSIHLFRGSVEGAIAPAPSGDGGFGYDPIFIPEGFDDSFSRLSSDIKNKISHRAKAMRQFLDYLGA